MILLLNLGSGLEEASKYSPHRFCTLPPTSPSPSVSTVYFFISFVCECACMCDATAPCGILCVCVVCRAKPSYTSTWCPMVTVGNCHLANIAGVCYFEQF